MLASYYCLLDCFHQTIINTVKHGDHKSQWTQDVGSKPRKKPLQRGQPKNNLLSSHRIRSNEKSKTQIPRLSPLTSPKSALLPSLFSEVKDFSSQQ